MSALPANVIEFKLPKRKPKVVEKVAPPDQRKFAVLPMAAVMDKELHGFTVKVLAVLCSYCNRAGLTWVGQQRIADHLGVAKQQVARAMKQLRDRGHIEIVSKGWRGEKANTVRVIFAADMTAQDAIAVTSSQEDTRPPEMKRREAKEMTEPDFTPEQMAANRKRLKEMLGGLADRDGTMHYGKPERIGEIMARKPRRKAVDNPVDNSTKPVDKSVDKVLYKSNIDNIIDNTGVVQSQKTLGIDKVISIYKDNVNNRFSYDRETFGEIDLKYAALLCEVKVTEAEWIDACQTVPIRLTLAELADQVINSR